MKSFGQILGEVDAAAQFVQAGGVAPDMVTLDDDFFASIAHLPDDEIVPGYAVTLPDLGPAAVTVETMDEFHLLYHALGRVHGFPVDAFKIGNDVYHERAHLDINQQLGYRVLRYGLLLTDSRPPITYAWWPFNLFAEPTRQVTKLEIGLGLAAPPKPSDGDSYKLRAMGYSGGRDEVQQRVADSTNPRLMSMRLPYGF